MIICKSIFYHLTTNFENNIWISCGNKKITAFADEDLDRSTDNKTSAVHFLRFQLEQEDIAEFFSSTNITIGVNHPEYSEEITLEDVVKKSLAKDFRKN